MSRVEPVSPQKRGSCTVTTKSRSGDSGLTEGHFCSFGWRAFIKRNGKTSDAICIWKKANEPPGNAERAVRTGILPGNGIRDGRHFLLSRAASGVPGGLTPHISSE